MSASILDWVGVSQRLFCRFWPAPFSSIAFIRLNGSGQRV